MEKEWRWEGDLAKALKEFSLKPLAWNCYTLGSIFKRKKGNLLRLEGVQRSLSRRVSEPLLKLEWKLKEERQIILLQEVVLRLQKSRNV